MPHLINSQRLWLKEHGRRDAHGGWVCKETGKPINSKPFYCTLYRGCCSLDEHLTAIEAPQDRGGEVQTVLMLYCTACQKEPTELALDNSGIVEVAA
jgi:hypothetical protein